MDTLAAVFASLIAVFIPSDAGVARLVIENVISTGASYAGKAPYEFLAYIFTSLSQKAQDVVNDKKKLKEFLVGIMSFIKEVVPTTDESRWSLLKKKIKRGLSLGLLPIIPGGIFVAPIAATKAVKASVLETKQYTGAKVVNTINEYIEPNIESFVDLAHQTFVLVFAVTTLIKEC